MPSLLLKKEMGLEHFNLDNVSVLKSITPRYKYEDGKKTENILGYMYDCVNTGTFDMLRIFVESKKPIISNDELMALQEEGEHTFVEFENARLRPYYSAISKQIEDSIKADAVHIVKNN